MRNIVRKYSLDNLCVGPGDTIFSVPVETRRWHSLRSFRLQFDMVGPRAKNILQFSGLLPPDTERTGSFRFDAVAAEQFAKRLRSALNLTETMAYLGVARGFYQLFFDAGFIEPIVRGRSRLSNAMLFDKEQLDAFLMRVSHNANAVATSERPADLKTLEEARVINKCGICDVIRLLFHGELQRVSFLTGETGLAGYLVDPDEVRSRIHDYDRDGHSIPEISRIIGIQPNICRALVNNGWVPSFRFRNPVTGIKQTRALKQVFENFEKEYITLRKLTKQMGLKAPALVLQMTKEAHISPAFDVKLARAHIFRLDQIPWI